MRYLILTLALLASPALADERVALVVGMSDYPESGLFLDLDNPVKDARLIADSQNWRILFEKGALMCLSTKTASPA